MHTRVDSGGSSRSRERAPKNTRRYYFEGSDGDSPRGIIDLEAYTDITAQPDNVVRLATAPGREPQRTFYFQADSEEDCQAWISALIRERYFKLRDERDAYQELQGDFQAQTAHAQDLMAQATEEAEAAEASFADEARRPSGDGAAPARRFEPTAPASLLDAL